MSNCNLYLYLVISFCSRVAKFFLKIITDVFIEACNNASFAIAILFAIFIEKLRFFQPFFKARQNHFVSSNHIIGNILWLELACRDRTSSSLWNFVNVRTAEFMSDIMCDWLHGCNNRQNWHIAGGFMGDADPRRFYVIIVHVLFLES